LQSASRFAIGQPCETRAGAGINTETEALYFFASAHAIHDRADDQVDLVDFTTDSSAIFGSPDLGVRAYPTIDPARYGMMEVNLDVLDARGAQSVEKPICQTEILGSHGDGWHGRSV
jgi:hypothetical protein